MKYIIDPITLQKHLCFSKYNFEITISELTEPESESKPESKPEPEPEPEKNGSETD